MLKQRLLTALVLIPLVLYLIVQPHRLWFMGFISIALSLCVFEWFSLIPLRLLKHRVLFAVFLLICTMLSWQYFELWLWLGLGLWLPIIFFICTYPKTIDLWGHPWMVGAWGFILLPLVWVSLFRIDHYALGSAWLIYLLSIVWATDTGAYFVGKRWGKHRLIPQVSPGKTIEGALGGLACVSVVAGLAYVWFSRMMHGSEVNMIIWFVFAWSIAVVSMVGDLFVSLLKRRVHLKDTGALIPGHGGVLDRLDSLISATPCFYLGLSWFLRG